ncbi:hypothetical protein WN55_01210 [Dufourea novaeangliae]|uniref:Uncharacterized protein n=1 Tax=Dufourea novaeangliae TaxID=178035 RepID=A0A154NYJ7_DUFNO|nr:hypothetical protein WN55_01210 [Dufourea novaeangliae]
MGLITAHAKGDRDAEVHLNTGRRNYISYLSLGEPTASRSRNYYETQFSFVVRAHGYARNKIHS